MADPTPEIRATRYRVELGTYGANVVWDQAADGWAIESPAVSLVQSALAAMGLLDGTVPDPATFRYATLEAAQGAATAVLQAANQYMTAVLSTRPQE